VNAAGRAQNASVKPASTAAANNEEEAPAVNLSPTATAGQRSDAAWKILTDAATDAKHTQTRLQALTALGLLRSPRSAKLIADAMADPGLDVRTAKVAPWSHRLLVLAPSAAGFANSPNAPLDITALALRWLTPAA